MLRKVYAHVRDEALRDAIDSLSRRDGWTPSRANVRKLMPRTKVDKLVSITRKAKKITAENAPEGDGWLRLVGE